MPLGLLQSQAEYEHKRVCVCVCIQGFSREPEFEPLGQSNWEKKGRLAWTSHFCSKCSFTFAEQQSPGFNVTTKYTGASRNKHLYRKHSSVYEKGQEGVTTSAFSTCIKAWTDKVAPLWINICWLELATRMISLGAYKIHISPGKMIALICGPFPLWQATESANQLRF